MKKTQLKTQNYTNQLNFFLQKVQANQIKILPVQKIKIICFNNFILNTIELIKNYLTNSIQELFFSSFIITYFVNKYQKKLQCVYMFSSYIHSWKKYLEDSLEARLFTLFLLDQQNKEMLKGFLKIRKQIIKSRDSILLDNISLTHQQSIGIMHRLYTQQKRKQISKGLNEFFIDLNFKGASNPKLHSCIFSQFLLTHTKDIFEKQLSVKQLTRVRPELIESSSKVNNGTISKIQISASKNILVKTYQNSILNKNFIQSRIQNGRFDYKQNNIKIGSYQKNTKPRKSTQKSDEEEEFVPENEHLNHIQQSTIYQKKQQVQSQSSIVQKYSQNWSRLIEQNEKFKNRMLGRSKQSSLNYKNKQNSVLSDSADLYNQDISDASRRFETNEQKANLPQIKSSVINVNRNFKNES